MTENALRRSDVELFDAADPLAPFRDRFVVADPAVVYLDGNSLGRLPRTTADRLAVVLRDEWGGALVEGWERWIDLPTRVGDLLGAAVLGAAPGQVLVCDSTTVNLYKLVDAALHLLADRRTVVAHRGDFPTDRYVLDGLAGRAGVAIRWVDAVDDVVGALDRDVALVVLSHVDYRTGKRADLAGITAAAHAVGALVLWDLSHAAGAISVGLDTHGVDLAVGCTYKYLNAGPGAPAYLYVSTALQPHLRSPIQGWFGAADQFTMGPAYEPAADIRRFLTGTPNVLGLYAVEEGASLVAEAGVGPIQAKAAALTDLAVVLADAWLEPLGFTVLSPRDARARGAHVSLCHPEAARISVALRRLAKVVPDFRPPDVVRLGFSPLTTRFVDVWDGIDRLRTLVASGAHNGVDLSGQRVR